MPTATAAPAALAASLGAPAAVASGARKGKINGGNLGVAATGVMAGIQLWSRAGGILAGGSTMVGTLQDGSNVDVLGEQEYLGHKYFQVRGDGKEGWIDGRFVEVQPG